ncbi:class I SAM-dependent methyltransferase [Lacticaseibacillus kribbianus]|uniref:class I SAM-dependent methyltransferase n=1 Tax=Lacticaseibacillus kribbianus TaxID=2926292 RepID=UPI001CD3CEFC|nr:methyltransferase domain-containing protein [Lacticaseibacillus kribbianus]
MDTNYPKMREAKAPLPTSTGVRQPLWQALSQKAPKLAGARVLAIHAGDGWFCRYAVNQGAIAVLGVDHDAEAISAARAEAASDRLRYRIMPDDRLDLLTGPYDVIVGTFDLQKDDLHLMTQQLSALLRPGGHLIAAVATRPDNGATDMAIKDLFSTRLTIEQLYQVSSARLTPSAGVHLILTSRVKG